VARKRQKLKEDFSAEACN